jgi:hypothetical protein
MQVEERPFPGSANRIAPRGRILADFSDHTQDRARGVAMAQARKSKMMSPHLEAVQGRGAAIPV